MATIVAAAGGGNWNSGGTWVGGVAPTSADDVQLTNTSGNVTINVAAAARSLDCTGYTGTLTHNSGVTLSLGDGTAGLGNIALNLVAGMTYTLGNAATSAIAFVSTSATQQTITTGGKTLGNWSVNGAGSSYILSDANTVGTSATVTLTSGTLNTGNQTCTWGTFSCSGTTARTLTLGSSTITVTATALSWNCATVTNLTFNAGTSTIILSGADAIINAGTNTNYNNVTFSGSGMAIITASGGRGTGTVANLTRTGTASKTDGLFVNTVYTISNTLTLTGNSITNRLLLMSNVSGSLQTLTVNGSVSASNVDICWIRGAGTASWNLSAITGGSGDCGGNSGITFTAAAPQAWQTTSGGNWSDSANWTSRVPLPQDAVTINKAFLASQTIVADMPRLGRSVDWTGSSGSPTWNLPTNIFIFGSLTMAASITISGTGSVILRGASASTLTSAGNSFPASLVIDNGLNVATKCTLQDALSLPSGSLYVGSSAFLGSNYGYLDTNNQTVTCLALRLGTNIGSCTIDLGTSTVNLTDTTATSVVQVTVNIAGSTNALNGTNATFNITTASANTRNILAHAGNIGKLNYTVAGSTGTLTIGAASTTGTLTIGTLNFSDTTNARSLLLFVGATLAITNTFNVKGSSGKLITIASVTAGSAVTLTKASGRVACDYLSVKDITATGGATWYAGSHSVNVSGNSGWIFAMAPDGSFFPFI